MKQNIEIVNEAQLNNTQISSQRKEQRQHKQLKVKTVLLNQLQNELKYLEQLNDSDFKDGQDPYYNDKLLDHLQSISNDAMKRKLYDIQKLSRLALGKRILNIELKKKKDQRNYKLLKKEEIELFFRQNRIKRFDYSSLISEGLQNSKLIAKAYSNGKGFIESENMYKEYGQALAECNFTQTVKKVNNIFYGNYTGVNKEKAYETQIPFKIVWVVLIIFIFLGSAQTSTSIQSKQIVMLVLLGLIMLILMSLSIKIYWQKPSQNNAIQQSICDVNKYFKQINMQFNLRGTGIQWKCPNNFMYLQVMFHNGFPA